MVPEITSFHPLLSPEFALAILLETNPSCVSTAGAVWGSWSCCMSEEILCISTLSQFYHILIFFYIYMWEMFCSSAVISLLQRVMRKSPRGNYQLHGKTAFITRNLLFSIIFYQPEQKALEACWNKVNCDLACGFRGKFICL